MEIEVAPENDIRFFRLMKEIRLIYLRNGAFSARLDQDIRLPHEAERSARIAPESNGL